MVANGVLAKLPLPELNRRRLLAQFTGEEKWVGVYYTTVRAFDFRRHDPHSPDTPHPLYVRWNQQLETMRIWLWEVLLGPLDALLREQVGLRENTPVVLIPPGLLGLLPLHAAAPRTGSQASASAGW